MWVSSKYFPSRHIYSNWSSITVPWCPENELSCHISNFFFLLKRIIGTTSTTKTTTSAACGEFISNIRLHVTPCLVFTAAILVRCARPYLVWSCLTAPSIFLDPIYNRLCATISNLITKDLNWMVLPSKLVLSSDPKINNPRYRGFTLVWFRFDVP